MPEGRKIATCCYCGTRAVLVFDRARHELTCQACGAPLHDMKFMPKPVEKTPEKRGTRRPSGPLPSYPRERARPSAGPGRGAWQAESRKPARPKKKRKPLMRRMLEELWDEVEDIFD